MHWSVILNRLLLVARYGPSALIGPPVVRAEYWPARENVPVPEQTLLLLLTCNGIAMRGADDVANWRWFVQSTHIWSYAAAGDLRTFYVGTAFGLVWRTTDGGAHWTETSLNGMVTPLVPGTPRGRVVRLAVHPHNPSIVYAVSNDALYHTDDRGTSWRQISSFPASQHIMSLTIDPHNPGHIWMGTITAGVLRSIDSGHTWTPWWPV